MLRAETVEVGPVLAPEVQDVLEPLGRDKGRPRASPFQQRVRGDCRPVREAFELPRPDRLGRGQHRLLLTARSRHLRRPHLVAVQQDCVGEGAADVDAEDRHGATLRGQYHRRA